MSDEILPPELVAEVDRLLPCTGTPRNIDRFRVCFCIECSRRPAILDLLRRERAERDRTIEELRGQVKHANNHIIEKSFSNGAIIDDLRRERDYAQEAVSTLRLTVDRETDKCIGLRARLAAAEQELTDLRAKVVELDAAWHAQDMGWTDEGNTRLTAARRAAGLEKP